MSQQWYDFRLTWNAEDYGGVRRLYVPSAEIWLPDIVLYNRCVSLISCVSRIRSAAHDQNDNLVD